MPCRKGNYAKKWKIQFSIDTRQLFSAHALLAWFREIYKVSSTGDEIESERLGGMGKRGEMSDQSVGYK